MAGAFVIRSRPNLAFWMIILMTGETNIDSNVPLNGKNWSESWDDLAADDGWQAPCKICHRVDPGEDLAALMRSAV